MVLRKGRALANLAASDTSLGGRSVKTSKACTLLLAVLLAGSAAADESTMKELTPTGKLRVALVFAPSKSAFFVVKDASGKPRGVTVDLADALAKTLSVAAENPARSTSPSCRWTRSARSASLSARTIS